MDNKYFHDRMDELAKVTVQSSEKQESFFRHILIVAASTFGILVSLHSKQSPVLCIRLVFLSVAVLMSLGILTCGIALYDQSRLVERTREKFHAALTIALKEGRKTGLVTVRKLKRTLFCKKCSLILFVISLLLLMIYAILVSL